MKILDQNEVQQAAALLEDHRIVAFPTDTVFGVGVLFGSLDDLEKLKRAKHRPETKPVPVMAAKLEQIEQVGVLNDMARKLAAAFLPGPVTLILPLKDGVDPRFTNGNETVAVRIPDHPFVLDLISRLPAPLFVSSANISGKPAAVNTEQAQENLPNIDAIVDGTVDFGIASTIIDCTGSGPKILRPGPITETEIKETLESGF